MTRDSPILAPPVAVEVSRGTAVESRHRASALVVDSAGRSLHVWGDAEQIIYPRSAVKPLQVLSLIESGAAERFGVTDRELAVACGSHTGTAVHADTVRAWLTRLGLAEDALECGPHLPYDEPSAQALLRHDCAPSTLHNNCSGKHAGMLCTALHRGEPLPGYGRFQHPVQQRIAAAIAAMAGLDPAHLRYAIDGCGTPALALPLQALALAMARLGEPSGLAPLRRHACERVARAMAAYPEMVAGEGRFATELIRATGGRVLAKPGAEGVFAAALPSLGLGLALKIEDGSARASPVAAAALLRFLGALEDREYRALARFVRPSVSNWAGLRVGEIRPSPGWPPAG